MKNFEIVIGQRTAIGTDKSSSITGYIYKNVHGNDGDCEIFFDKSLAHGAEMVGKITFVHPLVLSGDAEDIERDMRRVAFDQLIKDGFVTVNENATRFWDAN